MIDDYQNAPTYLAFGIIGAYMLVERLLRKGAAAKSTSIPSTNANSFYLMVGSMLSHFCCLVYSAHSINNNLAASTGSYWSRWLGVLLMCFGLGMRYWAAKVLGRFYSRTLRIQDGQRIVQALPYSLIRHPGYLGICAMQIGATLAVRMSVWLFVCDLGLSVVAKHYRISMEERMLMDQLGDQYKRYRLATPYRLFPWIY